MLGRDRGREKVGQRNRGKKNMEKEKDTRKSQRGGRGVNSPLREGKVEGGRKKGRERD